MNSVAFVILLDGAPEALDRYVHSCQWQLGPQDGLYVVGPPWSSTASAPIRSFDALEACAGAISQDLVVTLSPRVVLTPFILAHLRAMSLGLGVLLGARRWVDGLHCGYSNPASRFPSPLDTTGVSGSQFVFHTEVFRRALRELPVAQWGRELPGWLERNRLYSPHSPLPIVYEHLGPPERSREPVAVVITVFSEPASYILRAVASCHQQLEPGDELVVVRGKGGTADLVFLEDEQFSGVRVVEDTYGQEVGGGRNTGVEMTQAPWIKFLDGDDVLAPYALRALSHPFPDQVEVVYGGMVFVVDGRYWKLQEAASVNLECLPYGNPFVPGPAFVRRKGFLEVGGFNPVIGFEEDYDLWLRLARRFGLEAFAPHPQVLCYYCTEAERRQAAIRRRRYLVDGLPVRDYFRRQYGVECAFHERYPQAGGLALRGRRPPVPIA